MHRHSTCTPTHVFVQSPQDGFPIMQNSHRKIQLASGRTKTSKSVTYPNCVPISMCTHTLQFTQHVYSHAFIRYLQDGVLQNPSCQSHSLSMKTILEGPSLRGAHNSMYHLRATTFNFAGTQRDRVLSQVPRVSTCQ